MKKLTKIILGLPIVSAFLLTGCDSIAGMISGLIPNKDDESGDRSSSQVSTEDDWSPNEEVNKLKELGETEGFEITLVYTSSEEDVTNKEISIGIKDNVSWLIVDNLLQAYRLNDDQTISMAMDDGSGDGYVWYNIGSNVNYEQIENELIDNFYIADGYRDYLEKRRDTTFIGRPASVYYYDGNIEGYVTLGAVIDKELGIVLKWEAHSSIDFLFEVTSFKIGNQANIPEVAEE